MPPRRYSRCTAAQVRYIIDFMSNHPELISRCGNVVQLEGKWHQLRNALREYGPDRSIMQWKHSWRDLVRHAREEKIRLDENPGIKKELSIQASAILEVIRNAKSPTTIQASAVFEVIRNAKSPTTEGYVKNNDNSDNEDASVLDGLADTDDEENSTKTANASLIKNKVHKTKPVFNRRRRSSNSSDSYDKDNEHNHHSSNIDSNMLGTLNKFIEYKKAKERLAHEREMKSVKQNEKMMDLLGRMVNVIEDLAPSIKKCLDRNFNEG